MFREGFLQVGELFARKQANRAERREVFLGVRDIAHQATGAGDLPRPSYANARCVPGPLQRIFVKPVVVRRSVAYLTVSAAPQRRRVRDEVGAQ